MVSSQKVKQLDCEIVLEQLPQHCQILANLLTCCLLEKPIALTTFSQFEGNLHTSLNNKHITIF